MIEDAGMQQATLPGAGLVPPHPLPCSSSHCPPPPRPLAASPHPQVVFKHDHDTGFRLRVPEFSVAPGELVAVVGRVGAGKSSLLQAILGNMHLVGRAGGLLRFGFALPRGSSCNAAVGQCNSGAAAC